MRFAHYWYLVCLLVLWLLAGCQEAPRSAQLPRRPPTPDSAQAAPVPPFIPPLPTPAQRGYHRYVGTVCGRRVLVELTVELAYPTADYYHCQGSFYYLDSGECYGVPLVLGWVPPQPLRFKMGDGQTWCTTQALGPILSGTCTARNGRPLGSFHLRESYAEAAHYDLLVETLEIPRGTSMTSQPAASSLTLSYLHLLGRDTLRPALARLQFPVPSQRRRAQRALAVQLVPATNDLSVWLEKSDYVTLNEAGLLAYYSEQDVAYGGSSRGYLTHQNYLFDLLTGQPLHLQRQLRPGGLRQLRRLLTRHARRDTTAHVLSDYLQGQLLRLPPEDFSLQPAGCDAYYGPEGSHDGNASSFQETISWAELRPLLRPHSPLWRLIRARGL